MRKFFYAVATSAALIASPSQSGIPTIDVGTITGLSTINATNSQQLIQLIEQGVTAKQQLLEAQKQFEALTGNSDFLKLIKTMSSDEFKVFSSDLSGSDIGTFNNEITKHLEAFNIENDTITEALKSASIIEKTLGLNAQSSALGLERSQSGFTSANEAVKNWQEFGEKSNSTNSLKESVDLMIVGQANAGADNARMIALLAELVRLISTQDLNNSSRMLNEPNIGKVIP